MHVSMYFLHLVYPQLHHNGKGSIINVVCANLSLVVGVPDELDDDVLVGLNLQHLQYQADEGRGLDVGAIDPAHIVQVHCSVHEQLGWDNIQQGKAGINLKNDTAKN